MSDVVEAGGCVRLTCSMQRRTADLVRRFWLSGNVARRQEAMTHVWSRASFSRIRKERRLVQAEEALLTIQYMFCADDSDWAPRGDNLGLFDGDGCVW